MNRPSTSRVFPACILVVLAALWLAGCATTPTGTPLAAVGPMPGAYGPFGSGSGYLQVFSATRPTDDGGIMYYPHRPYSVHDATGKPAVVCLHHAGPDDPVPFIVSRQPVRYDVYAEAAGLGRVQVPVVIQRSRLTSLFFERGGMSAWTEALMLGAPVVRAPAGRIIGAVSRTA